MPKRLLSYTLCLIVLLSLLAHGAAAAQDPTTTSPSVGGQLNLRLYGDLDTLNPINVSTIDEQAVVEQVYATLFAFNGRHEPTPYVAKSWSVSAGGSSWTIPIKQGIKFHDGTELTAEDVAYTLNTARLSSENSTAMQMIGSVQALDKYTVVINMREPYAPLPELINYGIVKKGAPVAGTRQRELGPGNQLKPVGAGPYRFVEYVPGRYVRLERNPNWFMSAERGGAPFIQTLMFKIIPSNGLALKALAAGELDVDQFRLWHLPAAARSKFNSVNFDRLGWGYLTLNTTRTHLNDKAVRQALTYGLNRQAIIDSLIPGMAAVPSSPIPATSWASDPAVKALPYSPDKARQLLEGAGYVLNGDGVYEKNGKPLRLELVVSSGSALGAGIANAMQMQWALIGVDLNVNLVQFEDLLQQHLIPGNFDIAFLGLSLPLDPDLSGLFPSWQTRSRYTGVDSLLLAGRAASDQAKRKEIYSQMQKKIVDDAPVILLYTNRYSTLVSKRVAGGITVMPGIGPTNIYDWWLAR